MNSKDMQIRALAHDRLADHFDELINQYDLQRRLFVLITEFLYSKDLVNKLILDAGCGTGRATQRLVREGADVVSLDLGYRLVSYTRDNYTCRPLVGSVIKLPFRDAVFDIVLSTEVIEHTPDPLTAVQELFRIIKPGGHLVLSTPGWLWQGPIRLASALKLRAYDGLENFVKPSQLRSTLEDMGGNVLEHRGIHILPFQITPLHSFLSFMDRYGRCLLPFMINQCIHCTKPQS